MNLIMTKEGLAEPVSYYDASEEEKKKVLNKCGPDGFLNKLVPDYLLGLDISKSCNLHDWSFVEAKTQEDHRRSDVLFLDNMKTEIRKKPSPFLLKYMRYGLAYIYFSAVRIYSSLHSISTRSKKKRVLK